MHARARHHRRERRHIRARGGPLVEKDPALPPLPAHRVAQELRVPYRVGRRVLDAEHAGVAHTEHQRLLGHDAPLVGAGHGGDGVALQKGARHPRIVALGGGAGQDLARDRPHHRVGVVQEVAARRGGPAHLARREGEEGGDEVEVRRRVHGRQGPQLHVPVTDLVRLAVQEGVEDGRVHKRGRHHQRVERRVVGVVHDMQQRKRLDRPQAQQARAHGRRHAPAAVVGKRRDEAAGLHADRRDGARARDAGVEVALVPPVEPKRPEVVRQPHLMPRLAEAGLVGRGPTGVGRVRDGEPHAGRRELPDEARARHRQVQHQRPHLRSAQPTVMVERRGVHVQLHHRQQLRDPVDVQQVRRPRHRERHAVAQHQRDAAPRRCGGDGRERVAKRLPQQAQHVVRRRDAAVPGQGDVQLQARRLVDAGDERLGLEAARGQRVVQARLPRRVGGGHGAEDLPHAADECVVLPPNPLRLGDSCFNKRGHAKAPQSSTCLGDSRFNKREHAKGIPASAARAPPPPCCRRAPAALACSHSLPPPPRILLAKLTISSSASAAKDGRRSPKTLV